MVGFRHNVGAAVGRRHTPTASALVSALLVAAAVGAASAPAHAADIARGVDAILSRAAFRGARVGVVVIDLSRGKTIYEREGAAPRILASNTKILTTAAALDRLGGTHRIETVLYRRGLIDAETLRGDLVVVGGGDPTFGARFYGEADGPLGDWARTIRAHGIEVVTGDLVLDDRLFDRIHQHPDWPRDQLDRWYEAPVSALALNDGCIDVTVRAGAAPGSKARVGLAPDCGLLATEVSCRTTKKRKEHVVSVGRRAGRNVYVVRGRFLRGAKPVTVSIAQWEPARILGEVLKARLAGEGVRVEGEVRLVADDAPPTVEGGRTRAILAESTLVAELLPVINKRSQNHYAEMLLKRLGAVAGSGGSFAGGAAVVEAFCRRLGVPKGEVSVVDGSGMARGNRASARAIGRVLQAMASHAEASRFVASLSVGGVDGTLRKRFKGEPEARRVRAKTGTIRGVSALSGYVLPRDGRGAMLAFSILMNGVRGGAGASRRAQDEIVKVLLRAGVPAPAALAPGR